MSLLFCLAAECDPDIVGAVAEHMQDTDRAMSAFENALRHNPSSIIALTSAANIARNKDQFDKAIEYFQRVLNIKQDNGEVWGSMGESHFRGYDDESLKL